MDVIKNVEYFALVINGIIGTVVCITGLIGNMITIYVIIYNRCQKTYRSLDSRKNYLQISQSFSVRESRKEKTVSQKHVQSKSTAHRFGRSASAIFLADLAFFDSLVLITYFVSFSIPSFHYNEENYNPTDPCYDNCRNIRSKDLTACIHKCDRENENKTDFYLYLVGLVGHTGVVLTTMAFTIERFIAVRFPMRQVGKPYNNINRAICARFLVLITSLVYNIPRMLEKVEWIDGNGKEWTLENNIYYKTIYKQTLYAVCMFIVPCLILLVLNLKLVLMLKRSIKKRQLSENSSSSLKRRASRSKPQCNHVKMLVIVVVSMFLLSQSLVLADNIQSFIFENEYELNFYSVLAQFMAAFNSASNFFIYCIISRPFRQALIESISACCPNWLSKKIFS